MLNNNDICNSRYDTAKNGGADSVCADVGIKFRKQIADQCNFLVESPRQNKTAEKIYSNKVLCCLREEFMWKCEQGAGRSVAALP